MNFTSTTNPSEKAGMTTDIVWLSLRPETPNRGYWDEAMLERLFSDLDWRPAGAHGFRHHDSLEDVPEGSGAVVVLPARHHGNEAQALNDAIAPLPWCLLILAGDEEGTFPFEDVSHPNIKLWVMTPQTDRSYPPGTRFIPNGPAPDAYKVLPKFKDEAAGRPLPWVFSGQVTHRRRQEAAKAMRDLPGGRLVETPGFTQGLDHEEYFRLLASARVAPCPGGPCTQDTFRLWEALEAGAYPLVDAQTPEGRNKGFWNLLFPDGVPFPLVEDWNDLRGMVKSALLEWPTNVNRVSAAYLNYKRSLAYHLLEDLDALRGDVIRSVSADDQITVLMPTSTIPGHPSTEMIQKTIGSIRDQLPQAEIIIMCDGIRPEQEDRRVSYEEYLRCLLWLCNNEWHNVVPVIFDEHLHQANITREVLPMVKTPYILFVEHDTPIGGEIDWSGLLRAMESGEAGVIRLHHEAQIHPEHRYLTLGYPREVDGVRLVATLQWSQRPHLADVNIYRWMIPQFFGRRSRTMIEDVMHGVVQDYFNRSGVDGWNKFGLHIYAPSGDSIQRSFNLDGRQNDPKYDMYITKED